MNYTTEQSAQLGRADAMADFSGMALESLRAYAMDCADGRIYLDGMDLDSSAYVEAFMVEATARKLAIIADTAARNAAWDAIDAQTDGAVKLKHTDDSDSFFAAICTHADECKCETCEENRAQVYATDKTAAPAVRAKLCTFDDRCKCEACAGERATMARESLEMTKSASVESLKVGEFVKRKRDASKVYKRGAYDRSTKRYSLEDQDDCGREVFVKRGTVLFYDFLY